MRLKFGATTNNNKTPAYGMVSYKVFMVSHKVFVDWYCVHIEHTRLTGPLNQTFRNLLIDEYAKLGQPRNCRVYVRANWDGSYSYFFSPGAAERLEPFVRFWQGVAISEPTNLLHMQVAV